MVRIMVLGLVGLGVVAAPAFGQMDVQRLVWQCNAQAQDRGLSGRAFDEAVDRCLAERGVGGPPATGQARPSRPAPAAAGTAPSWRVTTPSPVQASMTIVSADRAFSWSFDCTSSGRPPGSFVFTTFFTYPAGTTAYGYTREILIDNVGLPIEVDGSEGGVALSDAAAFNIATLSPGTRQRLAEGTTLRIPVRTRAGARRDAVFNLVGGQVPFSDFERRCRSLR